MNNILKSTSELEITFADEIIMPKTPLEADLDHLRTLKPHFSVTFSAAVVKDHLSKRFSSCHNKDFNNKKHKNAEKEKHNENKQFTVLIELFLQLTDLRGGKAYSSVWPCTAGYYF